MSDSTGTSLFRSTSLGLLSTIAVTALALGSARCGDNEPSTPTSPTATVTTVSVTCTPLGAMHQCDAVATLSNNTTLKVTGSATWTSSNPSVATVNAAGLVTPLSQGQTEIRARFEDVIGGMAVTIGNAPASVTTVAVTCTPELGRHTCAATATLIDGSLDTVTNRATWTTSNPSVATVGANGSVTHLSSGQTQIRATYQNVTGSATITIAPEPPGTSVVLNELASRGPNGSDDEFIELRNDSASSVQVGGWRIMRSDRNGATTVLHTLPSGRTLGPGCHYLLAHNGFIFYGPPPDDRYGNQYDDDGGVALVMPDGSIVDQVGMSNTSAYREGAPLSPLPHDSDTRRTYGRAGRDTNDNQSDFRVSPGGSPQNAAASCTIR